MRKKLTPAEFSATLTDEDLKVDRLILGALCFGAGSFLLMNIILYSITVPTSEPSDSSISNWMTIITLIFSFLSVPLARILFKKTLLSSLINTEPKQAIRTANITRLAVYEGAAFLGLTALILSIFSWNIYFNSVYWMNLLPVFFLFFYAKNEFPSREKYQDIYKEFIYEGS